MSTADAANTQQTTLTADSVNAKQQVVTTDSARVKQQKLDSWFSRCKAIAGAHLLRNTMRRSCRAPPAWRPHPTEANDRAQGGDQAPCSPLTTTSPLPRATLYPSPTCNSHAEDISLTVLQVVILRSAAANACPHCGCHERGCSGMSTTANTCPSCGCHGNGCSGMSTTANAGPSCRCHGNGCSGTRIAANVCPSCGCQAASDAAGAQ